MAHTYKANFRKGGDKQVSRAKVRQTRKEGEAHGQNRDTEYPFISRVSIRWILLRIDGGQAHGREDGECHPRREAFRTLVVRVQFDRCRCRRLHDG